MCVVGGGGGGGGGGGMGVEVEVRGPSSVDYNYLSFSSMIFIALSIIHY